MKHSALFISHIGQHNIMHMFSSVNNYRGDFDWHCIDIALSFTRKTRVSTEYNQWVYLHNTYRFIVTYATSNKVTVLTSKIIKVWGISWPGYRPTLSSCWCNRQITFPPLSGTKHDKFVEDVRLAMSREPWNVNTTEQASIAVNRRQLVSRYDKI